MTKIKDSTHKYAQPPRVLQEKIRVFATCPEDQLAGHLATLTKWEFPKGDLHQWRDPLNRFDDILEKAVRLQGGFRDEYKIQKVPFLPEEKEILCQIMRVTTLLFGNSSYRTIYGSANLIYELLGSTDLDVLENALRLVSCFAARIAQRSDSGSAFFVVPKNRLWKFASGEGINTRQPPFPDLKSLLSPQVTIPPNWAGYHFHYYKKSPPTSLSSTTTPLRSAANTQASPVTPSAKPREGGDKTTEVNSEGKPAEGWIRLHISPETITKKGLYPTFKELVTQTNLPEDDQYRLFVQMLIAHYYSDPARREQFLRCQLHAIFSLSNVCEPNAMERQLYNARPELIQQLVRLLHNDSGAGLPLKTIVLKTLRTLARNSQFASNRRSEHSRFHQILTALDSSLNHGILMTLLREHVSALQSTDLSPEEMQYGHALHRLIREFLETPQGSVYLGFAGVVPLLVEILQIQRPSAWTIVVTVADFLSVLLPPHRHNQLLPMFMDADGLGTVIGVIKRHVDYNLTAPPDDEGLHNSKLSYSEHQTLHTFLNLLHRLLKNGHGERVRNVVDSEVIGSLREIISHLDIFGGYIGYLAAKLIAVIIHNEPTSYAALHEAGLPQAFLQMIVDGVPPTPELINTIPNVFDAICINTQGKEMFSEKNCFEGFFNMFQSIEHCKIMTKGHCATDTGVAMDELLRHHPDLKDAFMRSYIKMLKDICGDRVFKEEPVGPKLPRLEYTHVQPEVESWELCTLNRDENLTKARLEEERTLPVLLLIRNVYFFSEGFFSTSHWIKDFIKEDGHMLLINILEAPTLPYDFGETRDGYSVRNLLRQFLDQNGPQIIPPLLKGLNTALTTISNSPVSIPITMMGAEDAGDRREGYNKLFDAYAKLHTHLAILQTLYSMTVDMRGRPASAFSAPFGGTDGLEALKLLGNVVRDLYWRGNQFIRNLPKKYRDALSLDQLGSNGRRRNDKPEIPDDVFLEKYGIPRRDPTLKNVEMIQYFISFIPKKTLKFFSGLSNSMMSRSKMNDAVQRIAAVAVADQICDVFVDLLRFEEAIKSENPIDSHLYWFCAINFTYSIISGVHESGSSQSEKSLQTLLMSRFQHKGGLQAVLDIVKILNTTLSQAEKSFEEERYVAIPPILKKALNLVLVFILERPIGESQQTSLLTNRERHRDQGHFFSLPVFIAETRATCLPVLMELMSNIGKLDKVNAQLLLSTLAPLVNGGSEEFPFAAEKDEHEPDEEDIQSLMNQGFERGYVYAALLGAYGNEREALQLLESRRHVLTRNRPATDTTNQPAAAVGSSEPAEAVPETTETDASVAETADQGAGSDTNMVDVIYTPETSGEALARLRMDFSDNLENYITDILTYHPELPFELTSLIKAVGKRESPEWIQEKMLELASRLASLEDDKTTKAKEVTACAHVLGLLIHESRYYEAAEGGIIGFLDSFIDFLTVEEGLETPWIGGVGFILEIVLRQVQLRQTRKRHDPDFTYTDIPEIEHEVYERLLLKLIDLLKAGLSDGNAVMCILRLLVLLTREGKYARMFRENNGIQNLLQLNHQHQGKLRISGDSIIIIRQIVEDDKIVLATIRSAISTLLDINSTRNRTVEFNELMRNKYAEVLRNPELFTRALTEIAKLKDWTSAVPTNRKLGKKDKTDGNATENGQPTENVESQESKPIPPETPKKSTLELLSHSPGVVHILLSELLSHHADSLPTSRKEEASSNVNPSAESSEPISAAQVPSNRNKLSPMETRDYAFTLFLLQTLAELLASYNCCKLEFVNYSRRGQFREPVTPSKPRSMILNYILNDLLPTGNTSYNVHSSQDMELEKRRGISAVAMSVITGLCKKSAEDYEHDDRPDLLINIRKFVLEGIARSFRDTLASTAPTQVRYSRYTSLAELCRKLLIHPNNSPVQALQFDAQNNNEMTKLMFEKGFIGLLATVVADVELDFPDVRMVINDILSSLKDLTMSVNRLAANSTIETPNTSGDVEEISTASSASDEEEMQERDETPDMFRNSALGILQGVVEDAAHISHNHHHLGDYNEYDDEMDFDDDGEDEEDEDDDDEDDDLDELDDEMDEDGDDIGVHAVEIIMEDEGGDEDENGPDSEHSSDSGMDQDGDEHDDSDEESHSHSIIDMLEEQQMEADQVDGADGWTTDSDSQEDNDDMEDEDESNEESFGGFPPPPIPVLDEDELDYSDEEMDEMDDVRHLMEHFEPVVFDPADEEEDDEGVDPDSWLFPSRNMGGIPPAIPPTGIIVENPLLTSGGFRVRTDMLPTFERVPRNITHRSSNFPSVDSELTIVFPTAPTSANNIHPMLVNAQPPPQPRSENTRIITRHIPQLAGAPPEIIRSVENLFGMQSMLSDLMDQIADGHPATISVELRHNGTHGNMMAPRIVRMRHPLGGGSQNQPHEESIHPFKMATEIIIADTSARWQQAAAMWTFLITPMEFASLFTTSIFKLLEPAAIEEEKIRKAKEEEERAKKAREEEERRIAQEEAEARAKAEAEAREREEAEARRREEERLAEEQAARERLAAEALVESSNGANFDVEMISESEPTAAIPTGEEAQEQTEANPEEAPPAEASTERIYTIIRGNRVDITGLGVDPEFLEAIPEDMREEVIYQHIRDRRAAAPPEQTSTLDPSFLEALPPDIRRELLEDEAADRRRQERLAQRQQAGDQGAAAAAEMDPASFFATLESASLRTSILLDQDDDLLAQLPPHLVAEVAALRQRAFPGGRAINSDIRRKPIAPKRKDGIQLLEKSGLATLIRLTFLRNRPEALQDILLELSRHRHTRIELVGLLLLILQEGSADVASVERSFSQLSVKAKGQDQSISPVKSKTKMDSSFISHISGENSPTLIARHCLELLNHLIRNNHSLPFYFLTEHDSSSALKRVNSKKGKGKEVITKESRYPINALLSLLDRSAILESKASTEEFARLLSDVTKPLLVLQRKPTPKEEVKPSEAPATSNPAPPSAPDQSATVVPVESSDTGNAEGPSTAAPGEAAESGESTSAPKAEPEKPVRSLTPPAISEHNLELLVLMLVANEVSRETFRATLATMHHLMAVPGALEIFGRRLAREAQRFGEVAQSDLLAIAKKFEAAKRAGNLKDVDLTEYTSRGSDQTKLLKIFKAIDYLFNRIQRQDEDPKANGEEPAPKRQTALDIYSQLSLAPLWANLSTCLSYLGDDSNTWPLAQPLLPLIESLLVACNHINSNTPNKRVSDSPAAKQIESLFFAFTEEHRKILNYLVHMQPSLMSGSFEMLAHNPKVLEFDNKRNYFNRKLHDRKGQHVPSRSITLNIRRELVFLDSFRSLCFRSGEEIKNARLNVRFQGEEGVDAGGLTREWYQVLARQMFDPNYALFTPVASDSATFHPNKSSYVNDEHLMFFKFVGRIIGKALYDGRLLDCHFSRAVYKHILNRPISVKDLEYYDNQYYKNLMWMLENPINDIVTETFSIEAEEYGVTHIIDLVPDGRTIPVTDENKSEYVRLVSEYRLQTSVKDQLKEFLTGFHDIIPADLISIFTEQELELLISGLPDIDIEDWKAHSTYSNYEASSPQIQWFWRAVRSFNKEEKAKLLQFATGTSKVPLNGFKELEGMQGTTKFTIVRDFGHKTRLPQSHTCFNQIDLPEYDSYEQLRTALLTAITMGTEGFGFA